MSVTKTGFSFRVWGDVRHHRNEVGIGVFYWSGGSLSFTLGYRTVSFGFGESPRYDLYRGLGFSRVFSSGGNYWEGYWDGYWTG